MTPVKYECDSKNLTGIFSKIENIAYGEINERSRDCRNLTIVPWATDPWSNSDYNMGHTRKCHYNDVTIASQITSLTIVYSTVYSRCRYKKTSKIRVTGLFFGGGGGGGGDSPVTGEFSPQRASNGENISIWLMTSSCYLRLLIHVLTSAAFQLNRRWNLDIRGQRPISVRTYFRHICSLGVNFMQLWFFVSNRFLI